MVIGGTGLTGKHLIDLLIADERYTVIALVRKPLPIKHDRLICLQFNFDNPDKSLVVADEIFCCLGTTITTAGSKSAFYKVDYEYVLTIAQAGYFNGAKKFALMSSIGANNNSSVFYSKTKGAIEEAVSRIGYESLFIFRPSLLLGVRTEFRFWEMIGKFLMKSFAFAIPKKYKAIEASQVANAMFAAMNSGQKGVHIVASDSINLIR
ncbi:MAG: NAD(P)H-binding protein [Ferruginibacter sp.]